MYGIVDDSSLHSTGLRQPRRGPISLETKNNLLYEKIEKKRVTRREEGRGKVGEEGNE
jgi:hypothetical protein